MGIELLIGGAIAAAVGGVTAAVGGANAAAGKQSAAMAQKAAADAAAEKIRSAAAPTAGELAQLSSNVANQQRMMDVHEAALKRDEKVLGSMDANALAGGKQMNDMMKGKEAQILAPLKRQREIQRREREQQLSQQMGPGWQSSTAGMEQMNRFDNDTDMITQQAQTQAFNSLAGFLGMNAQSRTSLQSEELQGFQGIGQLGASNMASMGNIQQRQMQGEEAIGGMKMKTAGAEYAGQISMGKTMEGLGGSLMSMGGSAIGSAIGSMGRGKGKVTETSGYRPPVSSEEE